MPLNFSHVLAGVAVFTATAAALADPPGRPSESTAWGKPRGGLQAGVRCAAERPLAIGCEPLALDVVVRNIGSQPAEFSFVPPDSFGYSQDGTAVTSSVVAIASRRKTITLAPGGVVVVGTMLVGHRRPKRNSLVDDRPFWPSLGAGQLQVGCDNVLGEDPKAAPPLATGYLDVEVQAGK